MVHFKILRALVEVSSGFVNLSHRTPDFAREILRELAVPFRAVQGSLSKAAAFLPVHQIPLRGELHGKQNWHTPS